MSISEAIFFCKIMTIITNKKAAEQFGASIKNENENENFDD
jgi:hypothetical protein